jgi:DNA polymerase III subunit epsilon
VNLALNHGIGVSSAHRALTDCQLIAALFDRMDDLEGMINKADRPKAVYRAQVSFEEKDLAKAAGFRWNPDKRMWIRRMATADTLKLQFPVQEILDSH